VVGFESSRRWLILKGWKRSDGYVTSFLEGAFNPRQPFAKDSLMPLTELASPNKIG
jgi:hypothetical protein